ncbi:MAG: hypothetical protein AAFV09_08525 [Pseudomonadota bacterium]
MSSALDLSPNGTRSRQYRSSLSGLFGQDAVEQLDHQVIEAPFEKQQLGAFAHQYVNGEMDRRCEEHLGCFKISAQPQSLRYLARQDILQQRAPTLDGHRVAVAGHAITVFKQIPKERLLARDVEGDLACGMSAPQATRFRLSPAHPRSSNAVIRVVTN